jgi:dCTP deaminase
MIHNASHLIKAWPLSPMITTKERSNGISYGLSEAGYDLRIKQDVLLHPFKRFALASTVERFKMPKYLVGVVHDKSTWARQGLSVFNTLVEPNWEGWLTLELVYHGWKPLRIKAGTGIAQILFHEIKSEASYNGKYQRQSDRPVPAIFEKG